MHNAVTLEALRVIEVIHQKGTFAAAAKALFKVPSALTYTVQKLESDLGVSLFNREGQKAVLTEAGYLVLREGREILRAAQNLQERVKQVESGWETSLTIAKDTIIPSLPLLKVIDDFCDLDKHVALNITEEALGGGWDALHSKRADIAIGVTGELPTGQYELASIGQIEFVFAVSEAHPLASYLGGLESQHISQYPAIVVADSSRVLPQRSSGIFESKQQIRVANMELKVSAQVAGIGVGFLPLHLAKPYLDTGQLVALSTALPRPPMEVYCAIQKGSGGKALKWYFEKLAAQQWFA